VTFTFELWTQSAHECSSLSVLAICYGGLWSELKSPQRVRERERASVSASRAATFRRSLDGASSYDLKSKLLDLIVPFLTLSGKEGDCSMLTDNYRMQTLALPP
jgi:hypothetical protein